MLNSPNVKPCSYNMPTSRLPKMLSSLLISLACLLSLVSAHGRIVRIGADGKNYTGWDPASRLSGKTLPALAAWSADNLGNIFVPPDNFSEPDITCHFNATPGQAYVSVKAGDTIDLQWNEWPTSHKGPVITYLASCNGSCTSVDKHKLNFVKIDESGWINATDKLGIGLGGTWASDILIEQNFTWTVELSSELTPGNYVLRHEIIALHVANETDGAQAYPQCVNLMVQPSSQLVAKPVEDGATGGELAIHFYKPTDPGILVDIHKPVMGKYDIPGPKLWKDAVPLNGTKPHKSHAHF
jgi:lytic cellulose monooxygenase (C1-hydroxylating)